MSYIAEIKQKTKLALHCKYQEFIPEKPFILVGSCLIEIPPITSKQGCPCCNCKQWIPFLLDEDHSKKRELSKLAVRPLADHKRKVVFLNICINCRTIVSVM